MHPIHPELAPLAHAAKEMTRAHSPETPERLTRALREAVRGHHVWLRPEHRVGDPERYMRHLLYASTAAASTASPTVPPRRSPRCTSTACPPSA